MLQIVKAMVDHGGAHIVMGNHEFNAICYATPDPTKPGDFLRTHQDKDNKNEAATSSFSSSCLTRSNGTTTWSGSRPSRCGWNCRGQTVAR